MKSLKGKHTGKTLWIVGKGPSLRYLSKEDIGDGVVIAINQSIVTVESLGLDIPVYSMQKDGGARKKTPPEALCPDCDYSGSGCDDCGFMVRPKSAPLLLHEHESKYCFPDYPERHVFDWRELGLPGNEFSLILAINIGQFMGCTSFKFISFDAHVNGCNSTYTPGHGITEIGHALYSGQVGKIKPHLDDLDYEWITPTAKRRFSYSFGVLVNDPHRLDMVLRQSDIDGSMHAVKLPETATKGLNKLLGIIEAEGSDIAVLCHQDMYFRSGWIDQVMDQISKLPDSWIVAGVIGKDEDGKICGRLHDMRMPLHFSTSHAFPHPASCFDECVIIVNMKKGFIFDEGLKGFDLYGTSCVCQAWEMGGTAWIIDAFCEHYCMRPFSWFPGKDFEESFKWIYNRFPNAKRFDSTVLGVEEKAA